MTYRLNRTTLRRTLGVGAAIAVMGGVVPATWALPETDASNQESAATAAEAGGAQASADVLVTIPGSHNKAMGCDADWAPDCAKAALTRDATGVYSATFTLPAGDYQYKVAEGDTIFVEKLEAGEGESVVFDQVLTVVNDADVKVGRPMVDGAKVTGKVVAHGKGKKILVFKYKAKSNYRKRQGHRQPFTKVVIEKIEA